MFGVNHGQIYKGVAGIPVLYIRWIWSRSQVTEFVWFVTLSKTGSLGLGLNSPVLHRITNCSGKILGRLKIYLRLIVLPQYSVDFCAHSPWPLHTFVIVWVCVWAADLQLQWAIFIIATVMTRLICPLVGPVAAACKICVTNLIILLLGLCFG